MLTARPLRVLALALLLPLLLPSLARGLTGPSSVAASKTVAADEKPVKVVWGKEKFEADAPPEELAATTRGALEFWRPWASTADYSMQLTADERVLFVHPRRRSTVKREMVLVRKTLDLFDSLLPIPAERAEFEAAAAAAEAAEEAEQPPKPEGWVTWEYSWGNLPELGTETCVLLVAESPEDYTSMLDFLRMQHEYLEPWVKDSEGQFGFTLEQPLSACWVEGVPDQEEWSPDGELVHRLFRLLALRDFGRQPYWLQVALGSFAEIEVNGGAYCFPYRNEWVGVAEHTGWDTALKSEFKRRRWREEPLQFDELASWSRGEWNTAAAHASWGLVAYLARFAPEEFPILLERLRRERESRETTDHGDGTWTRDPNFELARELQLAVLQEVVREEFLEELHSYYARGKSYKPPKN